MIAHTERVNEVVQMSSSGGQVQCARFIHSRIKRHR